MGAQKNLRPLLFKLFIGIILISLVGFVFAKIFPRKEAPESILTSATAAPSETADSKSGNITAAELTYDADQSKYKSSFLTEYAYADIKPSVAKISTSGWNLLLLNKNHIIPDNYELPLEKVAGSSVEMHAKAASFFNTMYLAAAKEGVTLTPYSGYRSITTQRRLFENKITSLMNENDELNQREATAEALKYVSVPGTSEHNAGLAIDIVNESEAFADTNEYAWLEKNAADYGFILRYPKGKEDITNSVYKPYHWRFVGFAAAKEMKQSGKCLEEYLNAAN